jgi:hypothetical protein
MTNVLGCSALIFHVELFLLAFPLVFSSLELLLQLLYGTFMRATGTFNTWIIYFLSYRKWQDARVGREYEEKRKAEEILKQRRQERARLSSYIYSSSQNGDKRYVNRPQGNQKCIHDGNMESKKMMDGYSKDITEKDSINKDNDVCCLSSDPTISKPCDLQAW